MPEDGAGFEIRIEDASTRVSKDGRIVPTLRNQDEEAERIERESVFMEEVGSLEDIGSMQMNLKACKDQQTLLLNHPEDIYAVRFSPDGLSLATGGDSCELVIWDVSSRQRRGGITLTSPIRDLKYSVNGQLIACICEDTYVHLVDAVQCAAVGSFKGNSRILSVSFSPQCNILAAGDADKKVYLINVPSMQAFAELQHEADVRSLSFSPCGGILAGGGGIDPQLDGFLDVGSRSREMKTLVWGVSQNVEECRYLGQIVFNASVRAVEFSPNGRWLAVGTGDRMVSVLCTQREYKKAMELPCAAGVTCLGWSSDSRFLASGGEDMRVSVWNLSQRRLAFQLPKVKDWLSSVCLCPNFSCVAACTLSSPDVSLYPLTTAVTSMSTSCISLVDEDESPPLSYQGTPAGGAPMPPVDGVPTINVNHH